MPRCWKCHKEWPDTMTACPDDGASLTMEVAQTVHPQLAGGAMAGLQQRTPTPPPVHVTAPLGARPPTPRPGPVAAGTPAPVSASTAEAVAQAEAEPVSQDLEPGTQVGEYRIEKKIGEGGMGAVYGAVHPLIGKRAAIKVISSALNSDASAVQRFIQEARSVNQIGHPNIVDVFAFGTLPDGRNYFVMEYLQGEGLANRLERPLPLGDAIEILDQVADALEAAHEKQIVHRDLKPDNVYLAAVRGGRTMVKLLDFGIAKLSVSESGVSKTRTGMMMGTPGYLSPEQARGKNVDHRTDIYALGCMTFEIACGQLPFMADNAMDIVLAHMTEPPPRPSSVWPEIPPPLENLILGMLAKHPDERPTLPQIRAGFSELVSTGLVTLDANRPAAFGSGLSRVHTPSRGLPTPPTGMPAVGTHPPVSSVSAVMGAVPAPTIAPEHAPTKKTGLIIGALAAVVVLGGGGIFMATRSGGSEEAKPAVAPTPQAAPQPAPPPPPPAEKVTAPKPDTPPPAPTTGTLDLQINVPDAVVTVDGVVRAAKVTLDKGIHQVLVTADGYKSFDNKVEVVAGTTVQIPVKLDKNPATTKRPTGGSKPASGSKPAGTASKPGSGSPHHPDDGTIDPGL